MEKKKLMKVFVSLPRLWEYRQIVVLTRPGVVYVNTAADEHGMVLIMQDLAA